MLLAKLLHPAGVEHYMKDKTLFVLFLSLALTGYSSAQRPRGDRANRGDRADRGARGDRSNRADRGGRGLGGRGGFDPSSFLDRIDKNRNGLIDPDEQEGPAQFLIKRLASTDSSIVAGRPIPVKKIQKGFEKMRSGRGSGDDRDSENSRGRGSNIAGRYSDESLMAELLVPGFGDEEPVDDRVLGFGPNAELMTAAITEADRNEARQNLQRYDKNRNQYIDRDEITSRFAGNPMDFDRNRDGRLSLDELAIRYARRRESKNEKSGGKGNSNRQDESKQSSSEVTDIYEGRRSYRTNARSNSTEGLPGYFTEQDRNGDGQLSMAEFMPENAEDWNEEELAKFFDIDFNEDGVITASESLRSVEEGPASSLRARASGQTASAIAQAATTAASAKTPIDQKYVDLAKRIIGRRDKNGDGVLTGSEWKTMLMSPAAADANRDGKITADEYARWTKSRESAR